MWKTEHRITIRIRPNLKRLRPIANKLTKQLITNLILKVRGRLETNYLPLSQETRSLKQDFHLYSSRARLPKLTRKLQAARKSSSPNIGSRNNLSPSVAEIQIKTKKCSKSKIRSKIVQDRLQKSKGQSARKRKIMWNLLHVHCKKMRCLPIASTLSWPTLATRKTRNE